MQPKTQSPAEPTTLSAAPERGKVSVAPEVLATIAALTAQGVSGVVRLAPALRDEVGRLMRRDRAMRGVKVNVKDDEVWVELHLIVKPDAQMFQVGNQVQIEVAEALETMVGIPVHAVDVYIEDVE